jgi:hypothetical protein
VIIPQAEWKNKRSSQQSAVSGQQEAKRAKREKKKEESDCRARGPCVFTHDYG